MQTIRATLTALMAFTISASALAADAVRGEQLAYRWCAVCHLVGPDQPVAHTEVPSFRTISGRRDFNAHKLAYLLLSPHPLMPGLALGRTEAEDIVPYLVSLRARRR